ncbi:NicO-domain-containing protein [Wallemia mellicola]|nr:NicO-domain-containing protein [Wallemia mellicola]
MGILPKYQTTILTRIVILISTLVILNSLLWVVTSLTFSGKLLSLALVAWTLGLRHGLDSDHIASIDNSIRQLSAKGIYPVTVGLYFATGHSSVVLLVTVALIAGAQVYDNLSTLEDFGGVIGGSISSAFLLLLGIANSITLYQAIQSRRKMKVRLENGDVEGNSEENETKSPTFLFRVLSPVLKFVDKPSKLLWVGILFSLGFDTSSSIVLLSVSALAAEDVQNPIYVLLFPLLFAAGMILVDSLDNAMMVFLYTPRLEWKKEAQFKLFENLNDDKSSIASEEAASDEGAPLIDGDTNAYGTVTLPEDDKLVQQKILDINKYTVIITALSVTIALGISIIQIMGLVVDNCQTCSDHIDKGDWIGNWWQFWVTLNDNSIYIGVGIIASFSVILVMYFLLYSKS